ncbi:hypothetical protein [Candidatus Kuenenia sp.]|uniref:hypothetical protein n=1 Tax=Candidatus Kuenenia sp. TaxID=2499824 RepID=UPI0032207EE4
MKKPRSNKPQVKETPDFSSGTGGARKAQTVSYKPTDKKTYDFPLFEEPPALPAFLPGRDLFDQCFRFAETYNLQNFHGVPSFHGKEPYHKFFKKTISGLDPTVKNWLEFIKANNRRVIIVISEDYSLVSGIAALTLYNAYAGFDFVYEDYRGWAKQAIEKYLFDPVQKQEDRPPMFRHDETFSRGYLPLLGTSLVLRNVNPHHLRFFERFINIFRKNKYVPSGYLIISAPEIPALSQAELRLFEIFNPSQELVFNEKKKTISFGAKSIHIPIQKNTIKLIKAMAKLSGGTGSCETPALFKAFEGRELPGKVTSDGRYKNLTQKVIPHANEIISELINETNFFEINMTHATIKKNWGVKVVP